MTQEATQNSHVIDIQFPKPQDVSEAELINFFITAGQEAALVCSERPTQLVGVNVDTPHPINTGVSALSISFTVPKRTRTVLFLQGVVSANGRICAHGTMTRAIAS